MSEASKPTPPVDPAERAEQLRERARQRGVERLVVRSAAKVLGLTFAMIVLAILAWHLRLLLLLVILSVFVAALLHPAVQLLTRRGMGRTSATLTVYAVIICIGAGLGFVVVHPVYSSAAHFATDLPHLVRQAQQGRGQVGHLVAHFHLVNYVQQHAPQLKNFIARLGKPALAVGKTVLSGVASLVTIAFVSFFVLLEAPGIFKGMLSWTSPERAASIRRVSTAMVHQVTGFMLGDFSTSVIAGLVIFVTLQITGVPFAPVLAIWVGLVDFLPLVGGLLAGVPTVGVAFLHSLTAGIIALIVFLVYQQIENHILYPIIVSRSVALNPLWVLLAVLVGAEVGALVGSTFGAIAGAILAVPTAGSIQVAGREIFRDRRARLDAEQAGGATTDD